MVILFLFFCSGATALIYEVVWSKYLSLMFGSTIQAQTVVLAVFMGGLALGNRLFGARADLMRRPLAWYGWIEVAIGIYAFCFTSLNAWADALYVRLGSAMLEQSALLLLLKGGLSVALLLGPTTLMGGTLPLLAGWLQTNSADAGRRSARFYSTNSLGAVFGAGLAGFFLVRTLGMLATLQLTALVNVIIGFLAIGLARREAEPGPLSVSPAKRSGADSGAKAGADGAGAGSEAQVFRWSCLLVAFTGAVSMGLEVLATRCLSLIFGGSLQSFAVVLMAFILGIGLGSAVIASPRWSRVGTQRTSVVLLLLAASAIGLLVCRMESVVELYRQARTGLAPSVMGYHFHELLTGSIAIVVLGIPAALLGAVLPLSIRAIAQNTSMLGDRVGRLLTWNTLGAVAGVLLTGFVLMPRLGLRPSFSLLAIALTAIALLVAVSRRSWAQAAGALVLTAGLAVDAGYGGEGWRHVMSSGVFRERGLQVNARELESRRKNLELLFYEDAADATVSVERAKQGSEIALRINGKPDASSEGDLSTQYLLAHLPMLARPSSKDVFVLGFGSGITGGAILGHPIERLEIAENCEPVLRAGRWFEPWNRGVLTNSRTRIWPEDARTVLKLSPRAYDIIISEPSNPWVAGIGSVFSSEFYELAASRLKPGGIMAQWFHIYEMNDEIVSLVLRTFASVYPYLEIWDVSYGDVIFLGSRQPWTMDPHSFREVFSREWPRRDLETIGLGTVESIWSRQIASQRTAFAIADPGPLQSDLFPVLEHEAPRAFFLGGRSRLLANFDERTWQLPLAPVQKQKVLGALPDAVLRPVFARQVSSNKDLQDCLRRRFNPAPWEKQGEILDASFVPCIFRPADRAPVSPELNAVAGGMPRRLLEARALLLSGRDRWPEGIRLVQEVLAAAGPDGGKAAPGLPLALYAAMAGKASLGLGEVSQARELLLAGLKLDAGQEQVQHLARVMMREKPVQVAELPSAP